MNRGLRAAATAALLLTPVALGACSAGQVAQTAEQNRDKTGAMTSVGDLSLRAVEMPYPTGGVYAQGSSARLLAAVTSSAETDDTLVRIEGDQFDSVQVVDPAAAGEPATNSGSLDLAVPANGILYLGNGTGPSVTLVGLADDLGVGQSVNVTFTFEQAGSVTIPVPVATSPRDLPRGEPFDFHGEEGVEQQAGG